MARLKPCAALTAALSSRTSLPREDLLLKLRGLTNLRAVRDPTSETGYKLEAGPFPGWAKVPEW